MDQIKPFQNESESLDIGELTIENRMDQVVFFGSLALTRDKAGLAQARHLKSVLDAVVAALESAHDLPDHVPVQPPEKVKNPFG